MRSKLRQKIAIVPGDPAGIGPELVAKLLKQDGVLEAADILLVGDAHIWHRGAEQANLPLHLNTITDDDVADFKGCGHLDLNTIAQADVKVAKVSIAGGTTSLRCLDKALDLAVAGVLMASCSHPLIRPQ